MTRRTCLFVDGAAMFGGHEVMLLRWIDELLLQDIEPRPRLLARAGSRLHELAPPAVLAPALPAARPGGLFGRLRRAWQDASALRRALRDERPRWVVFACGSLGDQVLPLMLARLWGARVLVYVPLLDTFAAMGWRGAALKDRFVRAVLARVPDGWIAITAGQAAHFVRWAAPRGPVFTLPNTVARAIESRPRLLPRALAPGERLRVLVLGRLDAHQKGLDLLLDYLEQADEALRRQLALRIVGEGTYGPVLQARCEASDALAECIELRAWMNGAEALANCDVLLLPSRFEGVPLVMLEAMALGVPVVASALPGIAAHLPARCLFAVGDLAHAGRLLLELRDVALRRQLADEGRAIYEAGASSQAFAKAVAELMPAIERGLRPGGARAALAPAMSDEIL